MRKVGPTTLIAWPRLQAGGGIVADSTPEGEYQESQQKARALVRAAQEAVRFAATRAGNR